jgi:hypothetical protein
LEAILQLRSLRIEAGDQILVIDAGRGASIRLPLGASASCTSAKPHSPTSARGGARHRRHARSRDGTGGGRALRSVERADHVDARSRPRRLTRARARSFRFAENIIVHGIAWRRAGQACGNGARRPDPNFALQRRRRWPQESATTTNQLLKDAQPSGHGASSLNGPPGFVSGFVTSRKVSICHIVRIVMADNPLQMKVDR